MRLYHLFSALCLFCLLLSPPATAKDMSLQAVTNELLDALDSFYPTRATRIGVHDHDSRLADYSARSVRTMLQKLTQIEKDLKKFEGRKLSDYDQINLRLAKANADIALLELDKIGWHLRSPMWYGDEATDGLYQLLLSTNAPLSERLTSIIARMKQVPSLFATARTNIKAPPPLYVEIAGRQLEQAMQFYKDAGAQLMQAFPERADEIYQVSTQAREAMNDFLTYVHELPTAQTNYALGIQNLDYLLSNEYLLDFDSDSALNLLQNRLDWYDSLAAADAATGRAPLNGSDLFVPASFTRTDLLDYYRWELDQVHQKVVSQNLATIPQQMPRLSLLETPDFLAALVTTIRYEPPAPFDTTRPAYIYVRPIPEQLDPAQREARYRYSYRRGFLGTAARFAWPGAHLQRSMAARQPDRLRRWHECDMLIDGWARYAEDLMLENNAMTDESATLRRELSQRRRTNLALAVVDLRIHRGEMDAPAAVDWFVARLKVTSSSELQFYKERIEQITYQPLSAAAPAIGHYLLTTMRREAEQQKESGFESKKYHDALLSQGSLPIPLLRESMRLSSDSMKSSE